ncbi:tetratricopeptide repeat protein [Spartinivicinus ruber]|uniref:tetratricopeptide repeat protein n=1 Tax=Spartinivicinus ruber TaxID=2683272 RepID=UPI0013D1DD3B|nr:tetratricopeptide repeat protein [Spartinivicinus ruber]
MDRFSEKLSQYLGYLASDPNNPILFATALNICIEEQQLTKVDELLSAAPGVLLNAPPVILLRGKLAFFKGDDDCACQLFSSLIDGSEEGETLRYYYGASLLRQYQAVEAVKVLGYTVGSDNLIKPSDFSPAYRLLLARALYASSDVQQAKQVLLDCIQQHPGFIVAKGFYSLVLWDMEAFDEAYTIAKEVLEQEADNFDARLVLAYQPLWNGQLKSAEKQFLALISERSHSGRAWLGLALVLMQKNEQAEAIKALQQTVRWLPQHVGSWNTLTWCYLLADNIKEAEHAALHAIELQPAFAESQALMGLVAVAKKQWDSAELYIRKALKLNPESIAARYGQLMLAQYNQDEPVAKALSENILNTEITEGLSVRQVIQQQMKKKLH